MKKSFTVTIYNQKFEAKSYEELQKTIKNDLLLNTWLWDNNIPQISDFYPTKVITKRFLRKPKIETIDYWYEVYPIDYWAE